MEVWDLKAAKLQGALKGAGGSIRALALHPREPLLASVGLDRYLRVHSTNIRSSVMKVYLKQQLTGVCWLPVAAPQQAAAAEVVKGSDRGQEGELGQGEDFQKAQKTKKTKKGSTHHHEKKKRKGGGRLADASDQHGEQLAAGAGKKHKRR